MRRLTLILSDLYLPGEALPPSEHSDFVALPNLEWFLRFADARTVRDWRVALAVPGDDELLEYVATAHFAAMRRVPKDRLSTSWFATPVHLEARLDHVRMPQRGLLRLSLEERLAWCDEFARSFGPELVLHDGGPRGFFLSGLDAQHVISIDPARVLGADIAASLPQGKDVAALRKLSAEIEMWLHGAALNRARAGAPRISSLWLWGGGKGLPPEAPPRQAERTFAGQDPWLCALAQAQTGTEARPIPEQFGDFQPDTPHGIVELTPMSDGTGNLSRLDAQWFGPARAALSGGALDKVEILANDRQFIIRRHAAWRFWRRNDHWMSLLRRPGGATQA